MASFGQDETETVNGKKYFVHIVEKKQTLYGIHKQYKVPIASISAANQGLEGGLSVGQKILIPIPLSNQNYYMNHVIKKGETLYGISKIYHSSVADLKSINPELNESEIQIGQVIVVPKVGLISTSKPSDQLIENNQSELNTKNEKPIRLNTVTSEDTIVKHTVLAHETLYSIAKRYMVTPDDIRKRNDLSTSGLKVGDIILVPVKKVNYEVQEGKVDSSFTFVRNTDKKLKQIIKKPVYKVALLLPLMYESNKSVMNRPVRVGDIEKLHPITSVSADFYHGFKMAADSLSKAGLNAEIYIYDTKRDTNTIAAIFKKNDFSDVDMIVGPFFQDEVTYVAKYCRQYRIPMVLPVNADNSVLYQNPFVYKTTASTMSQMDGMVDFLTKDYSRYNICIVKPSSAEDKALYDRARDRYNSAVKANGYTPNIIELDLGSTSGKDWSYKLRKDTVNIIVVPSNDVKFVTSVFTRVNNVLNTNTYAKGMKVIVFGLEDWNRIDDIDVKHRMRSEQHYASYRFLDYDNNQTNNFINSYRAQIGADPGISGVQGFDVGYYFLSAMYLYGSHYTDFLDMYSIELIQNKFKFTSVSSGNGMENSATCIVKYDNYELKFVSW